jgi:hypothetical protein
MNVSAPQAFALLKIFSRLEFALKHFPQFIRGGHNDPGMVQWSKFDEAMRAVPANMFLYQIDTASKQLLLGTLDGGPPQKLRVNVTDGVRRVRFEPADLPSNEVDALLEAARRVRNNLVHGGKERGTQQRRDGHDQELVEAAANVMELASYAIPEIKTLCWD